MIEHKSAISYRSSIDLMFIQNIDYKDENILFISNYIFDMFLHDFFITFLNGFRCVLPNKNLFDNEINFERIIKNHKITLLFGSNTLLSSLKVSSDSSLKILNIGGEKMTRNLYLKLKLKFGLSCKIFLQYGTTETTIVSSYRELNEEKKSQTDSCRKSNKNTVLIN